MKIRLLTVTTLYSGLVFFVGLFYGHSYAADTFEINTSCGGGFAATHHIYIISQDGIISEEVISHVLPQNNKEKKIIGRIDSREAKRLYSQLMEIDFNNINYSHPNNLSCSLTLSVGSKSHSVTWSNMANSSYPKEIKHIIDISKEIDYIGFKASKGKEISDTKN